MTLDQLQEKANMNSELLMKNLVEMELEKEIKWRYGENGN